MSAVMPTQGSSKLATALARHNIHYGWVVVAVTFLTLLVTAAAMGTPGVMIVPLEHEFGWQDAQISSALALRILLFGLFGPFAAAFMNRFGVRRVIVCALSLIATGMLMSLDDDAGCGSSSCCGAWSSASAPASPPWSWRRRWRRAGSTIAAAWSWACWRRVRRPAN